jgi:hypothetical protein
LKKNILIIIASLALVAMGIVLYQRNILSRPADRGDAPDSYGMAVHFNPTEGPYFGKNRGDDDRRLEYYGNAVCVVDDYFGTDDEDAFAFNFTPLSNRSQLAVFLPEINATSKSYTLTIPVSDAEKGDPVRAWIDFDGNGKFDENEKTGAEYQGGRAVTLTWILPYQLNTSLTYARFRTCKNVFKDAIEYSTGEVISGEDEDYAVRIISPVEVPAGLRDQLLLEGIAEADTIDKALEAINHLKLGDASVSYRLTGVLPSIVGINNMHEVSITGLRLGHDEARDITNSPVISTIAFGKSLENVSFQLIDIDGGDRIKIEGFYKGRPVKAVINNLSDNYYYQYNNRTGEVYSQGDTDAGTDSIMPSSLDMSVEVYYKGFTDSIRLSYFDDAAGSSGTYTLAGLSCRRYSFDPYVIKEIYAEKTDAAIGLSWNVEPDNNVSAYVLERSNNGVSFEVIARLTNEDAANKVCHYKDSTGGPVTQLYYYRVKTISMDNSASYSPIVRVRRTLATSRTGFKPTALYFADTINVVLLKDMPGPIQVNLYNYDGKLVQRWAFDSKLKADTILLSQFPILEEASYYLELVNDKKKYLQEVLKYNK